MTDELRQHNAKMDARLQKLLKDLENRAIREGLAGRLGVTFDIANGKIKTVREFVDASQNNQ